MGVTVPYYKYFNWNEYVNYNDGYGAILLDEVEGTLERQTPYLSDVSQSTNFNHKVKLPPNQTSCYQMFMNCTQYNQPFTFTSKVTNCQNMFRQASAFNQPITIGTKVTDCNNMFRQASAFNQPVTLGANVADTSYMFNYATNFNQPITLTEKITEATRMFYGATNFGQSVTIPSSVVNATAMLINTKVTNIYVNTVGRESTPNLHGILSIDNSVTKYVYCNNLSYINSNRSNYSSITYANSIYSANITWTAVPNGYYNATVNTYLYSNYTG